MPEFMQPMPCPRPVALLAAGLATSVPIVFAAAAEPAAPPPTLVRVGQVTQETLAPRRKVTAELRSPRSSSPASLEAGIVVEVLAEEGVSVRAGEPLARLDAARLELDLLLAESELAAAQADVLEREAEERKSIRDLALVEESRAAGAANERELLDARSARDIAAARLERAKRDVAVVEARIALLRRRLADMTVRAPFDGVVVSQLVEPGQWLPAGGAVGSMVELDRLEAWLSLPQSIVEAAARDAREAPPADRAILAIDATGETIELDSLRIVPEVERRGRTFTAIGIFANRARRLLPGMSASAYVPSGAKEPWLVVPKDAVLFRDTGPVVWALRPGPEGASVAMPVPVDLAFPLGDRWAIRPGALAPGDEVVVEGNERLMPMTPVAATGG
jgi:RND family efflux transporter MFP subunit